MKVEEVLAGRVDATGAMVETVYAKVEQLYAIYRTSERVMVHFADEGVMSAAQEPLGSEQRRAIAQLAPLRGEINGLIDGWRVSERPGSASKCQRYDRRVADALQLAFQGDLTRAEQLLAATKADLLEDRTSAARTEYLAVSALAAVALIVLIAIVGSDWFHDSLYRFMPATRVLWFGAGMGALGALFSIALSIRDRSLPTDLQKGDNRADAGLRILIGAVSASILFALLMSDAVKIMIGTASLSPVRQQPMATGFYNWALNQPMAVVIGFIAGFSERLASDLLGRTVGAAFASAGTEKQGATAGREVKGATGGLATETDPLGRTQAVALTPPDRSAHTDDPDDPPADEHAEGCLSDHRLDDDALTQDVELPEAAGGVEHLAATAGTTQVIPGSPSGAA